MKSNTVPTPREEYANTNRDLHDEARKLIAEMKRTKKEDAAAKEIAGHRDQTKSARQTIAQYNERRKTATEKLAQVLVKVWGCFERGESVGGAVNKKEWCKAQGLGKRWCEKLIAKAQGKRTDVCVRLTLEVAEVSYQSNLKTPRLSAQLEFTDADSKAGTPLLETLGDITVRVPCDPTDRSAAVPPLYKKVVATVRSLRMPTDQIERQFNAALPDWAKLPAKVKKLGVAQTNAQIFKAAGDPPKGEPGKVKEFSERFERLVAEHPEWDLRPVKKVRAQLKTMVEAAERAKMQPKPVTGSQQQARTKDAIKPKDYLVARLEKSDEFGLFNDHMVAPFTNEKALAIGTREAMFAERRSRLYPASPAAREMDSTLDSLPPICGENHECMDGTENF